MHASRSALHGKAICIPRKAGREHRLLLNAFVGTTRSSGLQEAAKLSKESSIPDVVPHGLTREQLPKHVAIITDGNARWARQRGQPTAVGHRAGLETMKQCIECCKKWGVHALTVYGFSLENWGRGEHEVAALMRLMEVALTDIEGHLVQQDIRLRVIGAIDRLPKTLQTTINRVHDATESCSSLHFTIALSYGSRQDIVAAAQKVAVLAAQGVIQPHEVDEGMLQSFLGTGQVVAAVGEPDLLIRTSGEQRLSNFLLWELAYTELVFAPCYWPDFGVEAFADALRTFAARSRRFGRR